MYGSMVFKREYKSPTPYKKKTAETYTDRELKNKLCGYGC